MAGDGACKHNPNSYRSIPCPRKPILTTLGSITHSPPTDQSLIHTMHQHTKIPPSSHQSVSQTARTLTPTPVPAQSSATTPNNKNTNTPFPTPSSPTMAWASPPPSPANSRGTRASAWGSHRQATPAYEKKPSPHNLHYHGDVNVETPDSPHRTTHQSRSSQTHMEYNS